MKLLKLQPLVFFKIKFINRPTLKTFECFFNIESFDTFLGRIPQGIKFTQQKK